MKIIFDYNRTLFDPEANTLYPGVLEVVSVLSKNHELFLVSKDEPGRVSFFDDLGISDFFTKKVFIAEKTIDLFKELTENAEDVLVVGDRIEGEICIGNTLGYTTVWIAQGKFAHRKPQTPEEQPDHIIQEIRQLIELVKRYE